MPKLAFLTGASSGVRWTSGQTLLCRRLFSGVDCALPLRDKSMG